MGSADDEDPNSPGYAYDDLDAMQRDGRGCGVLMEGGRWCGLHDDWCIDCHRVTEEDDRG